ncbi:MAG: permease [Acholeplasmataceae bacterium]|nr:permease [Acholeplasmataceae bacterium]
MKTVSMIKKNKLLVLVALAYVVVLTISPEKAMSSVENSLYYLIEMLQVLPVIFLLTVVLESLVPKEVIMRGFGEKSGFKGNLLALLLGSISAGPIYAAFPISKTLLGKGASISNIVIILSTWAVVKVPMLANEAKFLGVNFMVIRWVLTVIAIFAMAYITGKFIKKKDLPADANKHMTLEIRADYCIGCGLCVKMLPEYYEMNNNKAVVCRSPDPKEALDLVKESIIKCPSQAIVFSEEEKAS